MKHYYFGITTWGSDLEGEEFLVGADTYGEAVDIAETMFPDEDIKYYGRVTEAEAEASGLDEY